MDDFQKELGGDLLASVSRSFYLSLRILPNELRETASLAYLLARTTDTVADTPTLPGSERLRFLQQMGAAVAGSGEVPQLESLAEGVEITAGEIRLLKKYNRCLEWLESVSDSKKEVIRKVMESIIKGQSNDLRKFSGDKFTALSSEEELEQYTYDVAGSVGVFWTEIGFDAFGNKFANLPSEEMKLLGENYGKGLQLLNILRDLPEDLAAGRCYIPGSASGAEGESIWTESSVHWKKRCRTLLGESAIYVSALNGRRLRLATGLPALIGARTLNLLESTDWESLGKHVKVPRGEVRTLVLKAGVAGLHRQGISNMILKLLSSDPRLG